MFRIFHGDGFFLVQDWESGRYFVWRQATLDDARTTMETLTESWQRDELERAKDLQVNFVATVELTLFQRSGRS